jgi:hypothetical protein
VANGCRATGLFSCIMNIFRPHGFPLEWGNINATPVKHPVGEDQWSAIIQFWFFAVHFCRDSPTIKYQPCLCQDWTGTAKQITSTPYKKYFKATQKENTKQDTKSKTWRLASNALLCPSKRRKRRVCWDPNPSDLDTELAVPEDEKKDADCVYCAGRFSEDHNWEEWIRCAKYFRWAYTLCAGMEEDCVCESFQG